MPAIAPIKLSPHTHLSFPKSKNHKEQEILRLFFRVIKNNFGEQVTPQKPRTISMNHKELPKSMQNLPIGLFLFKNWKLLIENFPEKIHATLHKI